MVIATQIERGDLEKEKKENILKVFDAAYWWREGSNYSRVNFYDEFSKQFRGKKIYHPVRASDKDIEERVSRFVKDYIERSKSIEFQKRENRLSVVPKIIRKISEKYRRMR